MGRRQVTALLAGWVVCLSAKGLAQSVQQPAPPTLTAEMRAAMMHDLNILVRAQEAYYSRTGKYASTPDQTGVKASKNVRLKFVVSEDRAWAAVATFVKRPGATCVVWVGLTDAKSRPRTAATHRASEEGEAACD
jgi:hypothetical protein